MVRSDLALSASLAHHTGNKPTSEFEELLTTSLYLAQGQYSRAVQDDKLLYSCNATLFHAKISSLILANRRPFSE